MAANSVALDTRNRPPAFADQDTETDGVQNTETTRKVEENTKAVAADDANTDDANTDEVPQTTWAAWSWQKTRTPTQML